MSSDKPRRKAQDWEDRNRERVRRVTALRVARWREKQRKLKEGK